MKRLLALGLALCLALCMLPAAALAADTVVTVDSVQALNAAFQAATPGTVVRLAGDIDFDRTDNNANDKNAIVVPGNADVVLDLNGHGINFTNKVAKQNKSAIFVDGTLIIRGPGAITAKAADPASEASGILVRTGGNLTVESGEVTSSAGFAISGNGTLDGTAITIRGGKITSTNGTAIYHPQEGTLTIAGGEISGPMGIQMRDGDLVITGGVITGTGTYYNDISGTKLPQGQTDGTNPNGVAVSLEGNSRYGTPSLSVTGGRLESSQGAPIFNSTIADAAPIVNVSGNAILKGKDTGADGIVNTTDSASSSSQVTEKPTSAIIINSEEGENKATIVGGVDASKIPSEITTVTAPQGSTLRGALPGGVTSLILQEGAKAEGLAVTEGTGITNQTGAAVEISIQGSTSKVTVPAGGTVVIIPKEDPPSGGTGTGSGSGGSYSYSYAAYAMAEGGGSVWYGGGQGLRFRSEGSYSAFRGVQVDGAFIAEGCYTAEAGSTILTLKPAYLDTLATGAHTLRMEFNGGYSEAVFNVGSLTALPKTGGQPGLSLAVSLLATGAALILLRKRDA